MEQLLDRSDYITDKFCLVDQFYKSFKEKSDYRIGVELERVCVDAKTFKAINYYGDNGIAEFLRCLVFRNDYEEKYEGDNVLGLAGKKGFVTLEPGSQVEFSTKPFNNLKEAEDALEGFNKLSSAIGKELGFYFLGSGIQPLSTHSNIQMIPKARYDVMSSYLPTQGSKAPVMMKESAGTQTAVDFSSEEDAMRKYRVTLGISPIITAMFANSPIRGGKLNGFKSYRASGWLDTDNDRCGLVSKSVFDKTFSFKEYVEIVLDVPMFFIEREGRLINMHSMTFRQFLEKGYQGYNATMEDWMLHMTTFFPDVRLKNYIEIRNCDCQRADLAMALPALIKGLIYNEDALAAAEEIVDEFTWQELNELRHLVPKYGLDLKCKRYALSDIASELVALAENSLKPHNESFYLERLKELVSEGKCPADVIIDKWESSWNGDISKFVEYSRYE